MPPMPNEVMSTQRRTASHTNPIGNPALWVSVVLTGVTGDTPRQDARGQHGTPERGERHGPTPANTRIYPDFRAF